MKFELSPFHRNVPESELLDDLRRVAGDLSVQSLSQSQYDQHGKFCAATFKKRFDTWNEALAAAGLIPTQRMNISSQDLINDIKRVASLTGSTRLTKSQYRTHGLFSEAVVYRHLGSWPNALKSLGLTPGWTAITTEELFENLENVWRHLGRQPTIDEMIPPLSRFNGKTYAARFGGYRKALEAFVAAIEIESSSSEEEMTAVINDEASFESPNQPRKKTSRTIGWRLRFLTLRRDGFRCRSCGKSPANHVGVELVVDHRVAWSKGGETTLENLQTLCLECNGGKSDLDWESPQNEAGASG